MMMGVGQFGFVHTRQHFFPFSSIFSVGICSPVELSHQIFLVHSPTITHFGHSGETSQLESTIASEAH